MERSKKDVFGRVHDCYALFCGILADNHGKCRQFWIGRVPQSKYPMDVKLDFMKLTPKEDRLEKEDPVLLRSFRAPPHWNGENETFQ